MVKHVESASGLGPVLQVFRVKGRHARVAIGGDKEASDRGVILRAAPPDEMLPALISNERQAVAPGDLRLGPHVLDILPRNLLVQAAEELIGAEARSSRRFFRIPEVVA